MKLHPLTVILIGCLISSIGFNVLVIKRNQELEKQSKKVIVIIIDKDEESFDFTGM